MHIANRSFVNKLKLLIATVANLDHSSNILKMFVKPFKMKMITLRRLFWIFLFLLVFYAIYLLFVNTSFNELHYQPVNYKNFRQMSRLKARNERLAMNSKLKSSKLYKEIDCIINDDEYKISCLKSTVNQNVYLPFYFVKTYFDVYGKLDKPDKFDSKERETFRFQHSYSKIYLARERYDYRRKFLFFENYSVENRQRVKYVSGLYNVPVSTQWNSLGHLYPIQIFQFGLSHFNKMLASDEPKFIYLDADKFARNDLSDLKWPSSVDLKVGEAETFRSDLKEEPKREDEQLSIDQLTNLRNDLNSDLMSNDFNQSLNEEPTVPRKLKRRRVIRLDDSDKRSDDGQSDEQAEQQSAIRKSYDEPNSQSMNEESTKNRTIFLNNTSLVLTLNLTKKSAFYSSLFLTFRYRLTGNLRITVVLMNDNRTKFKVNYRNINSELFRNDNLIYGLGNATGWRMFARNVGVDLIKSVNLSRKKNLNNNLKLKNLHLYRVIFNGEAILDEIKLSSNGHIYAFANSVTWLLMKQDENGGWPSKVNKRLVSSSLVLNVNWHSSMAQGHGISLLMRMFHFRNEFNLLDGDKLADLPERNGTSPAGRPSRLVNDELARMKLKSKLNSKLLDRQPGDEATTKRASSDNSTADEVENYFIDPDRLILNNSLIYLNAAIDAVNLFKKNVTENGISAYFMGQYRFYEEFPTTPSLFVLNGFVYSLFGLYDLKMTLNLLIRNQKLDEPLNDYYLVKLNEVGQLFDDGVRTLKTLLPFYDTGARSLYDLRHFTLQNQPPNLSRWDYHSVHINLLSHMNTILNDPNIDDCVQRWIGYMKGKRAAHN